MSPGVVRAVPADDRETLRKAIAGVLVLTRENIRLRAEIADRDEMLDELRKMIMRLT